jgi:hypothetical protein
MQALAQIQNKIWRMKEEEKASAHFVAGGG